MIRKATKAARIVRWCTLAASTVFFLFFSRFISEHAVCPIGGFELFFNGLFRSGFSIAGLFSGMVLTFLAMSILSIVFRRAYCGYICPLGALQELSERAGTFILPARFRSLRVPPKVDRALRWFKYAVLASFVGGAALWGNHWMIPGDPFIALMGISGGGVFATIARIPFAVAFLFSILAFAFFMGRGFCKYLCPAGAWYALLSKLSPNRIVRDEEKCVDCGLCSKACPMGIDVAHSKKVSSAECIGCRECVNACARFGALSAPVGRLEVPAAAIPVISAAVFAGGVYFASASLPARGERPQGTGGEGRGVRQGNPAGQPSSQKVGYGGCSDCTGCGFCESGFNA